MGKKEDLLIVEGGRVKRGSEISDVGEQENSVRLMLREMRKGGRGTRSGAAGRKYDKYRGADNPNNPHGPKITHGGPGVPGGLKGTGVALQLYECTPFLAGAKSRRMRRHQWALVAVKQRKTRARKS